MALRVTRNTKVNVENKVKIGMAGAKRMPLAFAAASKPCLRPRTALGDIGNKVSEQPQAKLPLKKVIVLLTQPLCEGPPYRRNP